MTQQEEVVEEKEVVPTPLVMGNTPENSYNINKSNVLQELYKILKNEKREVITTDSPKALRFTQKDGRLQVNIPSYGAYNIAESGFNRLCKLLKAPANFCKRLPFENIQRDLSVQAMNSDLDNMHFIIKNNIITGISTKENNIAPLQILESSFQDSSIKIIEGGYFDEQLFINFTNSEDSPILNDTFGYGLSIQCDDTGKDHPAIDYYYYRMICSNGAIAKELSAFQRFGNKQSVNNILESISNRVMESHSETNSLIGVSLVKMKDQLIPLNEKKYIQYYLRGYIKHREDGKSRFQSEIISKECTYYDLMNFITDYAKGFALEDKRKLEVLAGNMLPYFKEFNPADEIFKGYEETKRKAIRKELAGEFED